MKRRLCNSDERSVWEVQIKGWIERDEMGSAKRLEAKLKKVLGKYKDVQVKVEEVHVVAAPLSLAV